MEHSFSGRIGPRTSFLQRVIGQGLVLPTAATAAGDGVLLEHCLDWQIERFCEQLGAALPEYQLYARGWEEQQAPQWLASHPAKLPKL